MASAQRRRLILSLAAIAAGLHTGLHASTSGNWPAHTIRLVVPFPPGGSSDILGRLVAAQLKSELGADVFVENRPGATTQIGTEAIANAPADGYNLLLASASVFTVLPQIRKLNFTIDDFDVIGGVASYIAVMAVRKDLPIENLRDFIAYARQRPGELTFGSAGDASAGHVYGATLARDTGIELRHVPYRGSVAAVNALVAGEIDFIIDGAVINMVQADRVRPLATFYEKRHPDLPAVPTLKEAGVDLTTSRGAGWSLLAPKGTPPEIVARLSTALQRVLEQESVQQALVRANSIASWQAPEDFRRNLLADQKMYAELLPTLGISQS
ncbi:Bug family tripartite tricarboxylate transporter substrate binding protein [Verticiella sediminum]|nr:tripartite tricarboxylate transporter substrate binding protein [Verticiella sediminum]